MKAIQLVPDFKKRSTSNSMLFVTVLVFQIQKVWFWKNWWGLLSKWPNMAQKMAKMAKRMSTEQTLSHDKIRSCEAILDSTCIMLCILSSFTLLFESFLFKTCISNDLLHLYCYHQWFWVFSSLQCLWWKC